MLNPGCLTKQLRTMDHATTALTLPQIKQTLGMLELKLITLNHAD